MSTYILMKFLESVPRRYDRWIRFLTPVDLDESYARLCSPLRPGDAVLDVGCGSGALSLAAARRGARVTGIDVNAGLLEIAAARAARAGLAGSIAFYEKGVAELDQEGDKSYDAALSGLCFSELSPAELDYTLRQCLRLLRPGGLLLVADEVRPDALWKRAAAGIWRAIPAFLTVLFTGYAGGALVDLPGKAAALGFQIESIRRAALDTFMELRARKPGRN